MAPPLWLVDASSWDPSQAEFDQAVDQFCDPARAKAVRKFVERADQKRALLSTLLQRKACCEVAGVSGSEVAIERTKGMKPYGVVPRDISRPNFNFNASHDGDYVVLCAHPHYLCGVDVCHVERVETFADSLLDMLCPSGRGVLSRLSGRQRELYLFLSFSAKEAVTKAIGVGMAREFEGLTFEPDLPEHWASPEWASPGCEEHMMFRLVTRERLPNMQKKEWAAPKEEGSWCLGVRWVEGADGLHVVVTACGAAKWCVDGIGKFKAQLLQPELCPTRASDGVFSYSELSMAELLVDGSAGSEDSEDLGFLGGSEQTELDAPVQEQAENVQSEEEQAAAVQTIQASLRGMAVRLKSDAIRVQAETAKEQAPVEDTERILELDRMIKAAVSKGNYWRAADLKRVKLEELKGNSEDTTKQSLESLQKPKALQVLQFDALARQQVPDTIRSTVSLLESSRLKMVTLDELQAALDAVRALVKLEPVLTPLVGQLQVTIEARQPKQFVPTQISLDWLKKTKAAPNNAGPKPSNSGFFRGPKPATPANCVAGPRASPRVPSTQPPQPAAQLAEWQMEQPGLRAESCSDAECIVM